jgi:hypothetical protein
VLPVMLAVWLMVRRIKARVGTAFDQR